MKSRYLVIPGLILLIAVVFIQVVYAAPGENNRPNGRYEVEFYDLKKRGTCDSTKYIITNLESSITIQTSHYFTNGDSVQEYVFASSIGPSETQTFDLASLDDLPENFSGDVLITSTGEISGTVLPFPPCDISIEGTLIGEINTLYTFTANVYPPEALLPITYSWYEYGKPPIIHTNGISDSVELSWTTGGWKQIFVNAKNSMGSITGRFLVFIDLGSDRIFIPITMR